MDELCHFSISITTRQKLRGWFEIQTGKARKILSAAISKTTAKMRLSHLPEKWLAPNFEPTTPPKKAVTII